MRYKYPHFIRQNVAPVGAAGIGVYDASGKWLTRIPLGRLARPQGDPLYRFGLISDLHLYHTTTSWQGNQKFDNALTFFEERSCAFCAQAGDLTQTGLYDEGDTVNLSPGQFAAYKDICTRHTIPVYGICGNHESYVVPITNNLAELLEYTGNELHYKIEYQNDVFIFCGHPSATVPMSDEAFSFLTETLAANRGKRCFVFVHPVWDDDSGDAGGVYANHSGAGGTLLSSWSKGQDLENLLKQYPKAVLFHGHTHIKFEEQAKDKSLNYTCKNGFHSVHIPSVGRPRDIVDGALVYANAESQGYIVDVYDDCIVLNGWDLITGKPVALGTIRIAM